MNIEKDSVAIPESVPLHGWQGGSTGPSPRIPELDGLRGLAILLVLVSHYVYFQTRPGPDNWLRFVWPAMVLASSGVDLFFVLSGFLIGGILLDQRGAPNYFKTFYLRRFWRIVPIYAVVLITFWSTGFLFDHLGVTRPRWLFHLALPWYSYATMTQNVGLALAGGWFGANWLGVTWSLAIEEQFYLVAPLVLWLIPPSRIPRLVWIALVVAWLTREMSRSLLLYIFPSGPLTAYVLMPCRMDGLAIGILAAWAVRNPPVLAWLKKNRGLLLSAILLGLFGLGMFIANGWNFFSPPMAVTGFPLLACFYGTLLIYGVLFPGCLLGVLLRLRALRGLGIISYCVYLIHQPVSGLCHWLFFNHDPGFSTLSEAAVTLLALVIVLALATASWHFFEKPLIQRGHRYTYSQGSQFFQQLPRGRAESRV